MTIEDQLAEVAEPLTSTNDATISALLLLIGLLVIGIVALWRKSVKDTDMIHSISIKFSEGMNEIKVILATLAGKL